MMYRAARMAQGNFPRTSLGTALAPRVGSRTQRVRWS